MDNKTDIWPLAGDLRDGRVIPLFGLVFLSGCGYIGEPLPPLLNIPAPVTDLAAVQRGSKIIVQFSLPRLTTEGVVLKTPARVELRAGESPEVPFNAGAWAPRAKMLGEAPSQNGRARYELPVAEWVGKDVVFGVKVSGANGRDAGWSNFVTLAVIPPLERPSGLRAEAAPEGVRLAWQGHGNSFRVYRRAGDEQSYSAVADTDRPEWTDTHTEFGKTYRYLVQAIAKAGTGEAESETSEDAQITPVDRFPPAAPSGLTAVASTASIELVWERNTEPDLAGYRVYRAVSGGQFEKIADMQEAPSYSDRKIESGKTYRYAVSAADGSGNESKLSPPVEITAP